MNSSKKIENIKKWHTISSLLIFIGTLVYSLIRTKLNLMVYPLSKFGINSNTSLVWHSTLTILAIIILVNAFYHVFISEIKYKITLFLGFVLSILGLLGLIVFDMNHIYHNMSAGIFFFFYSVSIFFFGFLQIKADFRIAMTSMIISILMLSSATWLIFNIFSIPELLFIFLSYLWNIILIYNTQWRALLKKVGF